MSEPRVRTVWAPVAMLSSIFRDVRELLRNPLAFFGGLGGTAVTFGLLMLSFVVFGGEASADEEDDDAFQIEFEPGTLVKLGVKPEEKEIPEKIITQDAAPDPEVPTETVTEDETQKPKDEPPDKDKKPKEKPNKLPHDVEPKEHKSKLPTEKNTPYDDLPTVDYNIGDPFGDPGGWSDRMRAGDKWATAVMKALNNMPVGTYAAKAKDGYFQFYIDVCKDGSVGKVLPKGGTLDSSLQNLIALRVKALKLPRPPADVAKQMKRNCARIKYKFRWSAKGVK